MTHLRPPSPRSSPVGALLQHWRQVRHMSQLALATEAEVSPRHLCFIETGRARPSRDMVLLLASTLDAAKSWVLSGSLCGWGDVFIPRFELVVFIYIPPEVRMTRLAQREAVRYGADAIAPGGAHHAKYETFMTWAAAYDTGDVSRTRAIHEQWLATLPCPVLRLTTTAPVAEHLDQVLARLAS